MEIRKDGIYTRTGNSQGGIVSWTDKTDVLIDPVKSGN